MYIEALITTLAGATFALANLTPAPAQPLITPAAVLPVPAPGLAPRQQFSIDRPSPTGDLFSMMRSIGEALYLSPTGRVDDSLTTLCVASASITPPASLSSAYERYTSEYYSWASEVADVAHSIASECGETVSALVEFLIVTDAESCTKAVQRLVDVYEDMVSSATTRMKASTSATASSDGAEASSISGTVDESEQTETGLARTTIAASQSTGAGEGRGTNAAATTTSSSTGGAAVPRETRLVATAAAVALGVAGVVAAL
ncbi:hypothetical protein N657DRAFT_675401 [Parathielavia appendiculata]|uniref:DUF7735 domain-containing protein n=1 Tax=Parathielavia appendiculata TaxID=2587402 RepID=A0AAN6YYW2_9PEZI|nr:hypothetical protein N657DRAFT_675401 [Parathielavia appendiculata]